MAGKKKEEAKAQPVLGVDDGKEVKTSEKPTEPEKSIEPGHEAASKGKKTDKLKALASKYWAKKKLTIPVTVVVLLLLIFAVPITRYNTLGLFLKKPVTISVVDSKTGTPVSSAEVTLAGKTFKTNSGGKVVQTLKLGSSTLQVSKQYYQEASQHAVIALSGNDFKVRLVATGRQVPIVVVNKITGKPLTNATIKVLHTDAKTDKTGKATIVLPVGASTQKGSVSASGFNATDVTVQVTDQVVAANTFSIAPAGKLYFLSKRTGQINVMKSDLDGGNAQVVLAATGNEDNYGTILLASQDWKYLVLKSQRNGANKPASLYLIDTTQGDKVTTVDEGDAQFDVSGWSGHYFIYTVTRNSVSVWQPKRQSIKSFNADNKQLSVLDNSDASGTGPYDYHYEYFGSISILENTIVYTKAWNNYYWAGTVPGKQETINSVGPNGQGKKMLKGFDAAIVGYIGSTLYRPNEVYFTINMLDGSQSQYFEYDDGTFKTAAADDVNKSQHYNTYLLSPSNLKSFWFESRDGKNELFIGDKDGNDSKDLGSFDEYVPFGWFTDNYLLASKKSSELYIMDVSGKYPPIKVTDYHKPSVDFTGYGKGYGGF